MADLINSTCPHCEGALEYDEANAGSETACPNCGGTLLLPRPESQVEEFSPDRASKEFPDQVETLAMPPPMLPASQAVDSTKAYEYGVVPFVAMIKQQEGSFEAARQLQDLIRTNAAKGWEYVRLESVETYVAGDNGCFGIGGTAPRTTVYSMVVFRR